MRVDAHKNLQNWTLNSFFSFVFILYPRAEIAVPGFFD
jgi:hypothetical protein